MKTVQQYKKNWASLRIMAFLLFLTPIASIGQSVYKLTPSSDVFVKVFGTSNVHDWTMVSTGIESQGTFRFDAKDALIGLSNFSFTVQAKSLKSGKTTMDSRTYKSILADEFPKIVFQLKNASISQLADNRFQIVANGNLTIAGSTQPITLKVAAVVNADKSITCTGSEKLKLTDYKINPPSFMLGAMKVGNDLTIKFDLTYNKPVNAK